MNTSLFSRTAIWEIEIKSSDGDLVDVVNTVNTMYRLANSGLYEVVGHATSAHTDFVILITFCKRLLNL